MTSAQTMIARGQLGRLDGPRGPGIPDVLSIEVADRRLAIRREPSVFVPQSRGLTPTFDPLLFVTAIPRQ
jgi:hypothetical protein